MKHLWLALLALGAGPALAQNAYPPIPEIKYESNTDFLKLPFDMNFGEPVSVSVDGKSGDIYVANRSGIFKSSSLRIPDFGLTRSSASKILCRKLWLSDALG